MADDLRERVRRGAQWQDKTEPDWWKRISIERLDMGDCHDCIRGQLVGDFMEGLRGHGDFEWAADHGFTLREAEAVAGNWRALEQYWIEEIAGRRDNDDR